MARKLYAVLVIKRDLKGQDGKGIHDVVFVGAKSKSKAISKVATFDWSLVDLLWAAKSKCLVSKVIEVTSKGLGDPRVHTIDTEGRLVQEPAKEKRRVRR